jgi:ribosomal protein S18 acetylase RimI-like enzyme
MNYGFHKAMIAFSVPPRDSVSSELVNFPCVTLPRAIRPCRKEDLARIAEIHKARFLLPGTLLGQLSSALIAALYSAFLDRSIFLVHLTHGKVDGFVLGGMSGVVTSCKWTFLRGHFLFCLADLARRPHLWYLALRSFVRLMGGCFSLGAKPAPSEECRILSIAVDPAASGNGVGTALVEGFEEVIRATCREYSLHVLKTNSSAIRFYEKLAFQCVGETSISWKMRKELAAASNGMANTLVAAGSSAMPEQVQCVGSVLSPRPT